MIAAEYEAIQMYMQLAESTDNKLAIEVLKDIADEERVHAGEFLRLLKELDPEEEKIYRRRRRRSRRRNRENEEKDQKEIIGRKNICICMRGGNPPLILLSAHLTARHKNIILSNITNQNITIHRT
jgi:rubrerythrin